MNIFDILLIAALAVALGMAVRKIILDKKRGRRCGCDCGACAASCARRKEPHQ